MTLLPPADRGWLVVFADSDPTPCPPLRERWLRWWSRPGFRHCFVMRLVVEPDVWLYLNAREDCLDVGHVVDDDMLGTLAGSGATMLWVRAEIPEAFLPRGLLTCVSLVKQVLGLRRCWWVLDPGRLHSWLLSRHNGRDLTVQAVDVEGRVDGR